MKSSPLTLGNKKLHAATNLVFEEGVIKTRPGFCYKSLGAEGQFQGACEYRPKEGLSAAVLSEADSGIAVVADGVLWFNGNPISEALFEDAGAVHLYQAENYLILQNPDTDTFWWDGVGELVRSPGMNEQDWTEPEVPVFDTGIQACSGPDFAGGDGDGDGGGGGVTVGGLINARFLVINDTTEQPIANVVWEIRYNDQREDSGIGGQNGRFAFSPVPDPPVPINYTYNISRTGYLPLEDEPFSIPAYGEHDFVVRMIPTSILEKQCGESDYVLIYTDEATLVPNQRRITFTNTEIVPLTIFNLSPVSPAITITGPARPVTLDPNETVEFLVTGDLANEAFPFGLECTNSYIEKQCLGIDQTLLYDSEETLIPNQRLITLTNSSGEPVTLFALTPASPSVTHNVTLPATVAPGDTLEILLTGTGDLTGEQISADMDCTDSPTEIVLIGETLSVQLIFATYPGPVQETETIEMTGTLASGVFIGTCSKGDLTFQWDGGSLEWVMSFDVPVPTAGGAITPFHGPLSNGSADRGVTDGGYLDMEAVPFPNWMANIPVPP